MASWKSEHAFHWTTMMQKENMYMCGLHQNGLGGTTAAMCSPQWPVGPLGWASPRQLSVWREWNFTGPPPGRIFRAHSARRRLHGRYISRAERCPPHVLVTFT